MAELDQVSEDLLVDAWIRHETHALREDRDSDFWAVSKLMDLCADSPEKAFNLVLKILNRDSSMSVLEVLSAGALEDILSKHGEAFIDIVAEEARRNPVFARLLGGVWQNTMPDDIYRRVQTVWDRSGWDGNP